MSRLSYKTLLIIFFSLLIAIVVLWKFVLPQQKIKAAWWNDSWNYRVAVNIGNTSGSTLTNFQIPVSIGSSALVNAGKMQSDCDDIRVTDNNGNLLNYWVSGCGTTATQIWPKIPSIPNGGATIYIYYGNSSASSTRQTVGTADYPGLSCKSILDAGNSTGNKNYWIDPTNGDPSDKFQAYCDMTNDSGGWMLVTQSMINSEIGASTTVVKTTDSNNGLIYTTTISGVSDCGTHYSKFYLTDIIPWTQIKADYEFRGGNSCWAIFGNTNYNAGTNLTPFVLGTDTIRNQVKMGGSNGDNYDGVNYRCDNNTYNFWHYNQGVGTTRSAQVILRRSSMSALSGLGTGTACVTVNNPWKYQNIYIRETAMTFSATASSPLTEEVGTAPIAYWKFDEGVGTTAFNSIPNKKNGRLIGATPPEWKDDSECISGKCLYFNGVDNAISAGIGTDYFPLNTFSLCTWIKTSGVAPGMNTPGIFGLTYGLRFNINNSGEFVTWMDNGVAGSSLTATGNNLFDNKFHYLCLTYDGTNRHMYVDGVKKISAATTWLGTTRWPTNGFNIGRDNNDSTYFFKGYIDEPKIYPYARTAAQIKMDYNSRGTKKGSSVNLGVKSNTSPDLNSKLVAYYKFDEGVGTTAYDSTSNKNNGSLQTGTSIPTWSTGGKINKALNFTATNNSRVRAPITSTNGLNIKGAITYSVWFKRTTTTGYQTLIDMLDSCNSNGDGYYLRFANATLSFYSVIDGAVGTSPFTLANANPIFNDTSNWHHVVTTWDGTTNTNGAKMYLDGKLVSQTTATVDATLMASLNGKNLTIGSLNCNAHSFDGFIDEVKIYNSALSADEVKQDYNRGSAIQMGTINQTIGGTTTSLEYCIPGDTSACSPPIAEWNFEENTGTSAKDTSGNNNTATFGTGSSAPTWTVGKNNKGAALNFDGTTNKYVFTSNNINIGPSSWTISGWVKIPSNTVGRVGNFLGNYSDSPNLNLEIYSSGEMRYYWNGEINQLGTTNLKDNKWHYVTWIRDKNSNYGYMYIDGKIEKSFSGAGSDLNFTSPFWIGSDKRSGGLTWHGQIDNIKIYNYARTPAQIAYDYNKGAPIGWWKLDECQDSTAFDSSGLGNTGAISIGPSGSQTSLGTCQVGTSAAWTAGASGKINSSLNFDGNDDYVNMGDPTNSSLDFSLNDFTTVAWFKTTSTAASIILGKYNSYPLFYTRFNNGVIESRIGFDASTNFTNTTGTATNDGSWHQIIVVYKRNGNMTKYIDGKTYGTSTDISSSSSTSVSNANRFTVGASGGATQFFTGQIDDVRVYNYALTSEQVKVLYNGGAVNFN